MTFGPKPALIAFGILVALLGAPVIGIMVIVLALFLPDKPSTPDN